MGASEKRPHQTAETRNRTQETDLFRIQRFLCALCEVVLCTEQFHQRLLSAIVERACLLLVLI